MFALSGVGADWSRSNPSMRQDCSYPGSNKVPKEITSQSTEQRMSRSIPEETAAQKGLETFRGNGKQILSQVSEVM